MLNAREILHAQQNKQYIISTALTASYQALQPLPLPKQILLVICVLVWNSNCLVTVFLRSLTCTNSSLAQLQIKAFKSCV